MQRLLGNEHNQQQHGAAAVIRKAENLSSDEGLVGFSSAFANHWRRYL